MSLVGCRISVLIEDREWHEGFVRSLSKNGKHCVEFHLLGERRWLTMKRVAFFIAERPAPPRNDGIICASDLNRLNSNSDSSENENEKSEDREVCPPSSQSLYGEGEFKDNDPSPDEFDDTLAPVGDMADWVYAEDVSLDYSFAQSVLFKIYGGQVQETGHKTRGHACLTDGDKTNAKFSRGSLLYGELLPRGANKAFGCNRLYVEEAKVLFDLGMGTGKIAVQAFMQFRNLQYVYGIELSEGRYKLAEEAAIRMVKLLGKEGFRIQCKEGQFIIVTELDKEGEVDRVIHLECGNMFDVTNIDLADVVMMETDIPTSSHPSLCLLLNQMRLGARTLSYLDLRKIWSFTPLTFTQLEANKRLSDRFPTSWSVQRGHHFYLWNKTVEKNITPLAINTDLYDEEEFDTDNRDYDYNNSRSAGSSRLTRSSYGTSFRNSNSSSQSRQSGQSNSDTNANAQGRCMPNTSLFSFFTSFFQPSKHKHPTKGSKSVDSMTTTTNRDAHNHNHNHNLKASDGQGQKIIPIVSIPSPSSGSGSRSFDRNNEQPANKRTCTERSHEDEVNEVNTNSSEKQSETSETFNAELESADTDVSVTDRVKDHIEMLTVGLPDKAISSSTAGETPIGNASEMKMHSYASIEGIGVYQNQRSTATSGDIILSTENTENTEKTDNTDNTDNTNNTNMMSSSTDLNNMHTPGYYLEAEEGEEDGEGEGEEEEDHEASIVTVDSPLGPLSHSLSSRYSNNSNNNNNSNSSVLTAKSSSTDATEMAYVLNELNDVNEHTTSDTFAGTGEAGTADSDRGDRNNRNNGNWGGDFLREDRDRDREEEDSNTMHTPQHLRTGSSIPPSPSRAEMIARNNALLSSMAVDDFAPDGESAGTGIDTGMDIDTCSDSYNNVPGSSNSNLGMGMVSRLNQQNLQTQFVEGHRNRTVELQQQEVLGMGAMLKTPTSDQDIPQSLVLRGMSSHGLKRKKRGETHKEDTACTIS